MADIGRRRGMRHLLCTIPSVLRLCAGGRHGAMPGVRERPDNRGYVQGCRGRGRRSVSDNGRPRHRDLRCGVSVPILPIAFWPLVAETLRNLVD